MIPCFAKSPDEWNQCFSHPEVIKAGLVLNKTEVRIFDNPYYTKVFGSSNDNSNGSEDISIKNHEFATEYMKSIMAFSHGLLKEAFNGREELVDKFSAELKERYLSKGPERYRNDYVLYFCECTKL